MLTLICKYDRNNSMKMISITISEPQVEQLREIVSAEKISRSEVVRDAIKEYYPKWKRVQNDSAPTKT